jgi:hypothetical protein
LSDFISESFCPEATARRIVLKHPDPEAVFSRMSKILIIRPYPASRIRERPFWPEYDYLQVLAKCPFKCFRKSFQQRSCFRPATYDKNLYSMIPDYPVDIFFLVPVRKSRLPSIDVADPLVLKL